MSQLGKNLKRLRNSACMTQQELAEYSGITEETISFLENGHTTNPQLDTILKICEGLDCQLTDLIDGKKKR